MSEHVFLPQKLRFEGTYLGARIDRVSDVEAA